MKLTTASLTERQARGFTALFLIIGVWLIYQQTLGFRFLNYDDDRYVSNNPVVQQGLTWDGVAYAFTTGDVSNWLPLTWLSHMVLCDVSPTDPTMHHLVNILLHAINSVLVFIVFRRMTGAQGASVVIAFIFAAHPLAVESVSWVSERKGLLGAMFVLLALFAYERYVSNPKPWRFALVALCFLLGLLSKPTTITLPFVLLLCDYWPLRRFDNVSGRQAFHRAMRLFTEKLPLFFLCIPSAIMTYITQFRGSEDLDTWEEIAFTARLPNAIMSYGTYPLKVVWPSHLAVHYPHRLGTTPLWLVLTTLTVLVAFTIFAFIVRKRRPYLLFGWLWYVGMLVPVIGFVQLGTHAMADRYMYMPILGLLTMVVWGLSDVAAKLPRLKKGVAACAVVTICAFAIVSTVQTRHWHTSSTLYEHAIAVTKDNAKMHYSLASVEAARTSGFGGLEHMLEAVRLSPTNMKIWRSAGLSAMMRGRYRLATELLQEVVRQRPTDEVALEALDHMATPSQNPDV